MDDLVAHTFAA